MQLQPDLGRQVIEQGVRNGQDVILMGTTFAIAQAYFNLNSEGIGTITIETSDGCCGSLDFGKDLKFQVMHLLSKITTVTDERFKKISNGETEAFNFAEIGKDKIWISGLFLSGKLGKNEISLSTGEVFVPIILDKIDLIDHCVATLGWSFKQD